MAATQTSDKSANTYWTHEYSSASEMRRPWLLASAIFSGLYSGRSLARRLFVRNLTSTYRQSLLGFFWILIPTIAQIATWSFLAKQHLLVTEQLPGVPYIMFIAVGSLLWQLFFDAIQAPLQAVNANQGIITRINFPRESLILVSGGEVLFDFLVRAVLVTAICFYFGVSWSVSTLMAPVFLLGLFLLGISIGLLLTPIGILYHDIARSLSILSPFWMVLTPVVYLVPDTTIFRTWSAINPPAGLLSSTRDLLLTGDASMFVVALVWLGLSIPAFLAALVWFRIGFPIFVERLAN
jgi:lipopolysaccharide transport system permease protein